MSSPEPRRILLCEDDPDLRSELADTLIDGGHEVMTSVDGWDALHQMRVNRPDLVVLDLLMPVMTGWQFRAEQKRDPALADIPVVVISGSESAAASPMALHSTVPMRATISVISRPSRVKARSFSRIDVSPSR